jgi:hypothetical protein
MRHCAILALASLAVAWSAAPALAVSEQEPNDTIGTANVVQGEAQVSGVRSGSGGFSSDVDFFVFTGLEPGQTYDALLDLTSLGLGWFASDGTLLDSIAFEGFLELQELVADDNGEIVLAVCGHVQGQSVFDCSPGALGAGEYTLQLPEPQASALALTALATLSLLARRRAIRASASA